VPPNTIAPADQMGRPIFTHFNCFLFARCETRPDTQELLETVHDAYDAWRPCHDYRMTIREVREALEAHGYNITGVSNPIVQGLWVPSV
jgi:hypothetical protein